jgi:CheY-like chemotaxis protein
MCPSVLFKNEEAISQRKILVVDDNAEIRKLLVLHLKASGYDTVEAATGLEALKQARATSPDLIVMDLAMPAGNGDEVIASLKSIDARYTCHRTHSFPVRTASESCYRRRGGRNTL